MLRKARNAAKGEDVAPITEAFRREAQEFRREQLRSVEQMARRADPRAAAETSAPAHQRPEMTTPWVAPRNETEERLAGILQEVLGIDRVGIDDDFTELGGDSLLAIQVIARIRESFGVELKLRALFEAPSVAQLAVEVLAAGSREAEPELLEGLLEDLDGLSEEEVEALLAGDRPQEEGR